MVGKSREFKRVPISASMAQNLKNIPQPWRTKDRQKDHHSGPRLATGWYTQGLSSIALKISEN